MATDARRHVLMLVGAHHDDNELMAGTIARQVAAGWEVLSVIATDGRWTPHLTSDSNIAVRQAESERAAELLGMKSVCLNLPEGNVAADAASRRPIVELIRRHRPRVVVTHPHPDYHADHVAVSQLVTEAVSMAANPTVVAAGEQWDVEQLYYCDAWFMDFTPDVYVDVSDLIELKEAALACHRSQLGDNFANVGDMIELEKTRARSRGIEAGCRYAEAYRLVPRLGHRRVVSSLSALPADH